MQELTLAHNLIIDEMQKISHLTREGCDAKLGMLRACRIINQLQAQLTREIAQEYADR